MSGDRTYDHTAPESKPLEIAFALAGLALGLAMLLGARGIALRNETGGIDPRTWPTMIAVGMLLATGWMLFNAVTGRKAERDVDMAGRKGWVQLAVTVAMIALCLVLWQIGLSFLVLTPLLLIVCGWFYGLRGWIALVVFPAVITGLLFLVFQLLLKVPL